MLEFQNVGLFVWSIVVTIVAQKKLTKIRGHSKPVVEELWIYPIKSCKGFQVNQAVVTKRGFEFDRLYMVVDGLDGKFVSQRKYPRMALISTAIDYEKRILMMDAPGMSRLILSLDQTGEMDMIVNVWGDICEAVAVGGPSVCAWLNAFLNTANLQLVKMKDGFVRKTDPDFASEGQTGFADGFPFLLASVGSLNVLNQKLSQPVTMECFRPNIIVNNCLAYAEDNWKQIKFLGKNPLIADVVKPCSRCTIPNIDPSTGNFNSDGQPTKALKSFRTGKLLELGRPKWEGQIFFGQNIDHRSQEGQILHVGDEIEVLQLSGI